MSSVVQQADGTGGSANATLGVGGAAFGTSVTAGNYLDVFALITYGTSTTCTFSVAGGGTATIGTPIVVQTVDESASTTRQFFRRLIPITGSGTCPLVATFGTTFQNMEIYAAELTGLDPSTPFTSGEVANTSAVASGSGGASSSGNTPTLAESSAIACGLSYVDNLSAASTAGAGFTAQAPVWGAITTHACLTYETLQLATNAAVAATFVPPNFVDTYTFVAVYRNASGGAVTLTGQQATFSAGILTSSGGAAVIMLGQTPASGPGVSPDYTKMFQAKPASAFIAPAAAVSVTLTGQSATFSAGTLSPATSSTVTFIGQLATFSAGHLTSSGGTPVTSSAPPPIAGFISNVGTLSVRQ